MAFFSPGVYVQELPAAMQPIAGVGTSTAAFVSVIPDTVQLVAAAAKLVDFKPAVAKIPLLVTRWGDFTTAFGDLTGDPSLPASTAAGAAVNANQHMLAHAVYGFFNNGGTRAYIVRAATAADLPLALAALEAIDDIALVLAPGFADGPTREAVVTHCQKLGDRFAILDATDGSKDVSTLSLPSATTMAAIYMPWVRVFDPAVALATPATPTAAVPPSGHIAGIYARVDAARGVFKAPANEVILGALDVSLPISTADQDGLNPAGINCIRRLNGSILVWGARTAGANNGDLTYVPVRRMLIFLEKSLLQGTQWVVFEPNTQSLWQKINRNVTAFLTDIWRTGGLFGATAQEAFYVKCDADNNPPAQRDLGQVVIDVGVALVRPAEFVIFRISQWAGPGA